MTDSATVPDGPRDLRRGHFSVLRRLSTRWADEDPFGHINNAVHYQLFDTAVTGWLIEAVGDVRDLPARGVVAETGCRYLGELRFPMAVDAGLALARIGTSSVTYRLALFGEGVVEPAAIGLFVHVYVDPVTRRPSAVPVQVREALTQLGSWPVPGS